MPVTDPLIPVLVTTTEAADILGMSRQRVHELVQSGVLPCRYVGRQVVIRHEAVQGYKVTRAGGDSSTK